MASLEKIEWDIMEARIWVSMTISNKKERDIVDRIMKSLHVNEPLIPEKLRKSNKH